MKANRYMDMKPVVITHIDGKGSHWGISNVMANGEVYLTFAGKGCGKFPSRRVAVEITQMLRYGEAWIMQAVAIEKAKACVLRLLLGVAGICLGLAVWLGGGR